MFLPREKDTAYSDFTPVITDRRAIAELVKTDFGVVRAHARFLGKLDLWWKEHLPSIEALAPTNDQKGNVYELRRTLLASAAKALSKQTLLNEHQIRGVLASYFEFFKPEFKSIAFSGWGPELIPDDEILQSQFPEILAEMEQKRLRLAELDALFAAAMKRIMRTATTKRLARHKALEDEAKQLKADLRATEKKEEELVAAAREKIDRNEARRVILDRLHRILI